jgi:hypothetical protein
VGRLHVVGGRGPQPGGSTRLDRLLAEHWDAAEASLAYRGIDLRALVNDPTCTPRRLNVLLDHLPHDSPLAVSFGAEWWWQQDIHAQLLGSIIDALNLIVTSTAMTPMALGAKKAQVTKALQGVEPWKRPYEPPRKKQDTADMVRSLMSLMRG